MNDESLIESLLPAIDQQLESPDTPYVKATFTRLVEKENFSPDQAKEMLALCLADESNRMFIEKRQFDVIRYRELLESLPIADDDSDAENDEVDTSDNNIPNSNNPTS